MSQLSEKMAFWVQQVTLSAGQLTAELLQQLVKAAEKA